MSLSLEMGRCPQLIPLAMPPSAGYRSPLASGLVQPRRSLVAAYTKTGSASIAFSATTLGHQFFVEVFAWCQPPATWRAERSVPKIVATLGAHSHPLASRCAQVDAKLAKCDTVVRMCLDRSPYAAHAHVAAVARDERYGDGRSTARDRFNAPFFSG